MATDQIHPDLLNELSLGSVPLPTDRQAPQQAMPMPQTQGQFAPGVDPSQLVAQPRRPTFMSAFLANLGPSLAHGIAAGAEQKTLGGGIAAGVGGGLGGQEEQRRYETQAGLQAAQVGESIKQREAQIFAMTPSVEMQDAQGNSYTVAPRDVPRVMGQGWMYKARTEAAATQAGGRVQQTKLTQAGATERKQMDVNLAGQKLTQGWNEFQQTDQFKRWKDNQDNQTKIQVASLTANKAPAAMLQTATFAQGGIKALDDATNLMQQMSASGILGSNFATNKLEDFLFRNGAVDPSWTPAQRSMMGQLRGSLGLASSAMLRAHTGRTSQEIYDDFKSMLGVGQDWSALTGAMKESREMLVGYRDSARTASIQGLRSGDLGSDLPQGNGAKLNPSTAKQFLDAAGNDQAKAQQLAKQHGWSW